MTRAACSCRPLSELQAPSAARLFVDLSYEAGFDRLVALQDVAGWFPRARVCTPDGEEATVVVDDCCSDAHRVQGHSVAKTAVSGIARLAGHVRVVSADVRRVPLLE